MRKAARSNELFRDFPYIQKEYSRRVMSRLVRGVGLQHPALSAFPDRLLRWTCNYSWMEGLEFCVIVLCRTLCFFWSQPREKLNAFSH